VDRLQIETSKFFYKPETPDKHTLPIAAVLWPSGGLAAMLRARRAAVLRRFGLWASGDAGCGSGGGAPASRRGRVGGSTAGGRLLELPSWRVEPLRRGRQDRRRSGASGAW
jgi:hypothetical protein